MLRKKLKHPTRVVYKRVMFARVKYLSDPTETAAQFTTQLTVRPAVQTTAALETRSINGQNTRGFLYWLAL